MVGHTPALLAAYNPPDPPPSVRRRPPLPFSLLLPTHLCWAVIGIRGLKLNAIQYPEEDISQPTHSAHSAANVEGKHPELRPPSRSSTCRATRAMSRPRLSG